jgi:hypothetical protein
MYVWKMHDVDTYAACVLAAWMLAVDGLDIDR